jgi:5'-methylthioadenosine phosphorylase
MIGIVGGTGLYRMDELQLVETRAVGTPFGAPSAPLMLGSLRGKPVAFLARHGTRHELLPSEINFRANIWALKSVGVRTVISVSAVGSLRSELRAGELVLPAQYLDFTKGLRAASYFGGGLVGHVSTARPTCEVTAGLIAHAAATLDLPLHVQRTYVCIEGPRFGTRAESFFLRQAGADVVGMTNVPEAFLACEAQLGYCTIAIVTDYDCWMDDPQLHVTTEQALRLFRANLGKVQRLIAEVAASHEEDETRAARHRLSGALITSPEQMTPEQRLIADFLAL